MSDELKPCPFCKCSYEKDIDDYFYSGNHKDWCPLRGTSYGGYGLTIPDYADTIAAWNTRAERTCAKLPPITVQTCIVRRGGCEMEFGYWRCGECQCENFEGARYCMNCGAKVER